MKVRPINSEKYFYYYVYKSYNAIKINYTWPVQQDGIILSKTNKNLSLKFTTLIIFN